MDAGWPRILGHGLAATKGEDSFTATDVEVQPAQVHVVAGLPARLLLSVVHGEVPRARGWLRVNGVTVPQGGNGGFLPGVQLVRDPRHHGAAMGVDFHRALGPGANALQYLTFTGAAAKRLPPEPAGRIAMAACVRFGLLDTAVADTAPLEGRLRAVWQLVAASLVEHSVVLGDDGGMDGRGRDLFLRILGTIAREDGAAVLLVTSSDGILGTVSRIGRGGRCRVSLFERSGSNYRLVDRTKRMLDTA